MVREELINFDWGLIAPGIFLRKCIGKGSNTQVNDIEEKISLN